MKPREDQYILLMTDYFTKWVENFPVKDEIATTYTEVVFNEVIVGYECPLLIYMYLRDNYKSKIYSELCGNLEIIKICTSSGNPHYNGQAKQYNYTLLKMRKVYILGEQHHWDDHLGCLAADYRSTVQKSTGLTLKVFNLGSYVWKATDLMCGAHNHESAKF